MRLKSIIYLASIISIISCSGNKKSSANNAEDAFAKIDKKTEALFTKDDRKKSYQNSIAIASEKNKSFKKNVAYNGYGASVKKSQPNLKSNKTSKASSKKKDSKKFSYKRTNSSQTYSAYSTN